MNAKLMMVHGLLVARTTFAVTNSLRTATDSTKMLMETMKTLSQSSILHAVILTQVSSDHITLLASQFLH